MRADKIVGIIILAHFEVDNIHLLETNCADYDAYKALPQVVSYNNIVCGLTGWNSDRGIACYSSATKIAFPV